MGIEMIDAEFLFFSISAVALVIALVSLFVWGVFLLLFMEEIDGYFDSPDFPNRGYKGVWPWGMGRGMAYGIFLLFPDSWFVRKKFPHARKSIKINEIPRKIKFMVAFPMYTNIPASLFILLGGTFLKLKPFFS
ncbi:hypothetical protein [Halomonas elongata]|uniref:hypothetical protein n=1 Tax=Halomonas elongata TaxID=2746 RepID=UPI0023B000FE|nr:hypothetical protein [Halomonas elongata]